MFTFKENTVSEIDEEALSRIGSNVIGITKRKILIVDDDDFCRGLLFEVLKDEYYCKVVSTAEQALLTLKNESFDLVLTDIRMPKKNGLELLSDIKKLNPHQLVVIMTGYAGIDSTVEALRLHAFDFLSKPIDCDTLVETVERALLEVAINEENERFEEDIREAMVFRTDQVRTLFDVIYKYYRNLLIKTAESLEVRGVKKDGNIQRELAFALRLGNSFGLNDIELMALEHGILLYEGNKTSAPDEVLLDKHIFSSDEWNKIFQKESRKLPIDKDSRFFNLSHRLAQQIENTLSGNDEKNCPASFDETLTSLNKVACFAIGLCEELEGSSGELNELNLNKLLQTVQNGINFLADSHILQAFLKVPKAEWVDLYDQSPKYANSFEERFRRAFYISVVA